MGNKLKKKNVHVRIKERGEKKKREENSDNRQKLVAC
jgi:hypothetical protein